MYHKARNKVSYAINKAKRNYYFQKISSDMNPRDLWKTLKTVLPNKNNSYNVPSEMNANSFNEFFTTIGENVTKSIPSVMPVNHSNPEQQGFKTPLLLQFLKIKVALLMFPIIVLYRSSLILVNS